MVLAQDWGAAGQGVFVQLPGRLVLAAVKKDGGQLARRQVEGRALAAATRMIFAAAGIRAGMRVLDLGCGAGDVAFVAADLVGPEGYVIGVDRSPEALGRARLRANNAV